MRQAQNFKTRVGTLNLLVSHGRAGTFSTRLFARYQRNEKALVLALMEMYVEGVSTRKVKEATEELRGTSFSKSFVSCLAKLEMVEKHSGRSFPSSSTSPTKKRILPTLKVAVYCLCLVGSWLAGSFGEQH